MTKRLNVVHVTFHPSRHGGGVASFVWSIAHALQSQQVASTIAGISDDRLHLDCPVDKNIKLIAASPQGPASLGYAPQLRSELNGAIAAADLVHIHGLRTLLNRDTRRLAQRHGKPLIISPHGQLDPWLLNQRRFRKLITDLLWVRRNLRAADVIHAVSPRETEQIQAAVPTARIALAPPGIDAAQYNLTRDHARATVKQHYPSLSDRKLILFMGAIMPRKGPDVLARVWAQIHRDWPDWHVVFAGMDVGGFEQQVRSLITTEADLTHTTFLGEVPQSLKAPLLAAADLFVLPSRSEAFGIAAAEALAAGCPVITTKAAPWGDLVTQQCGWWIDAGPGPLVDALNQALALPDDQRRGMGERGRDFISQWCDWQKTAERLSAVYRFVLDHHPPQPADLYLPENALPRSFT